MRLKHDGSDIIVDDPYYKGSVQWMATHSQRYQERIEPLISDLAGMLISGGLNAFDLSPWTHFEESLSRNQAVPA